ncbi:MAG: hypothetical protein RH942_01680 [Kiloniellaceae bacterium]
MTSVGAPLWIGRLVLAVFVLYVCAILAYQVSLMVDADYLHEEMRLLFRSYLLTDPDLFGDDYLTAFVGAFDQPLLYDWITRLWLGAGGDLVVLHRLVPLICWGVFLAGLAVAARRLGDRVTVIFVVGLAVAQPAYLYQITSALPHSFAFPLLIWAFVALLHGSILGLAALTVLSGLLYPAMAPLVGLLLAWRVVISKRIWRQDNAGRVRNLLLLAVTGAVAVWLLLGTLSGPADFGAPLEPMQDVDVYPENGPEGRHFYGVFNPFTYVAAKAFVQFNDVFGKYKLLLLVIYGLFSIYGIWALPRERGAAVAMLAMILCGLAVCLVVLALKPFHIYRFVLYPAFTVLPLLFVVGVREFCRKLLLGRGHPERASAALLILFTVSLDGFDHQKVGYWWRLNPDSRAVVSFAQDQPPRTLFAIWPGSDEILELIPYLAKRPIFVMNKAHYPTYEGHIREMRARTQALIAAYFATEASALRALHCNWGVEFLVVEKAHFSGGDVRATYFAPFDAQIEEIWRRHRPEDFLLSNPDRRLVVLETESYAILKLSRSLGAADCEATATPKEPDRRSP